MPFDQLRGHSKEEHEALVSKLVTETAAKLSSVRGNTDGIRRVISDYVHHGMSARLPSGQLVCSFCLHSPHVLDRTELPPEERDQITKIFYEILPEIARHYETDKTYQGV
jgi:hypothetical protein